MAKQITETRRLYRNSGDCLPARRNTFFAKQIQHFAVGKEEPGLRANCSARPSRRMFGDLGERLGVQHLLATGYRIRERNFRVREGEIDIVAERGDLVAFVEVRCKRGDAMGTAAESLTAAKQRRLVGLADAYEQAREGLPEQRRIDVIAVDFGRGGRLLSLQHIEGAVSADVV